MTPWIELDSSAECDPAVLDNLVITGTIGGRVLAVERATGRIVWSHQHKGSSVLGVAVNGAMTVATVQFGGVSAGRGIVTALDGHTGKVLWSKRAGATIGTAPLIAGDTVQFGTNYPGLNGSGAWVAVSVTNGRELWSHDIAAFSGAPLLATDRVVVSSNEGAVWCLDASSARVIWRLPMQRSLAGSPVHSEDTIYVGGFDHNLYAIDLIEGAVRWRLTGMGPFRAQPTIAERIVYVGSYDENVYAVDARKGAVLWKGAVTSAVLSAATVTDDVVVVGCSDSTVHALDRRSGKPLWRWDGPQRRGGGVIARPLLDGGRLIVCNRDAKIYALDAATGLSLGLAAAGGEARPTRRPTPTVSERKLTTLSAPSGGIVVCDPIADPKDLALALAVRKGPHAVVALIADYGNEERVAALELRLGNRAPVEWREAELVDGSPARVSVDSGLAGFLDTSAAAALIANEELVDRFDEIEGAGLSNSKQSDWSWAAARLVGKPIDGVISSTGLGDGVYNVLAGYDTDGKACRLRIVFIDTDGPSRQEVLDEGSKSRVNRRTEGS